MNNATHELSPEAAAARISGALDTLRQELHPLENVLQAFRDIFIEKARLKAELPPLADLSVEPPDPARFEQGVPLTTEGNLIEFAEDSWKMAADRLIPAMEHGFPKLKEELGAIRQALADGRLNPQRTLQAMANGLNDEAETTASRLGVSSQSIQFVLGQIMKPLVEKKAEALKPLIKDLKWHKGYCPVCGSMPELAFLKGEEGQRWLRCAFCGHDWRYVRLSCPFCENEDQQKLMTYYIAGREQERAEVCHKCGRYVVSIDLRGRLDEAVLDVAAIGLVHLDMLSQEKGHLPAAICAWNMVSSEDISSSLVDVGPRISST